MKTKITLHGKLAKIYGKEFSFANIRKPTDVVDALDTKFPGFKKYLVNQSKAGLNYEFITNDDLTETIYSMQDKKNIKEIDIAPAIMGQDAVTLFLAVASAFVYLGAVTFAGTILGGILFAIGVGMIVAGIMYLLTPVPENEPNEQSIRAGIKNASFIFQSPQNSSTQGRPIPIGYGRLRCGSLVVGTTLSNFDLSADRQNVSYETLKSNVLLKIQESFGSSVSNYIRGYWWKIT